MKKVLATGTKYIFGGFGIAVLGLLMTLTYQALARLFPTSFANQMWGLVLFDIAAMCWALAFVFASNTTGQYALSAIGFLVGFVGTLGMVAAEVILSSGTATDPAQIGKWMTYGFILVTVLHAGLLYGHHATAPDIHEKINIGVARGEIVTEAIQQATRQLDEQKAELAHTIHNDIVSQVKRDLGLIPADPKMPIIPARNYEKNIPAARVTPTTSPLAVTQADIELARRINPLAAPYRSCPQCDERVPLTQIVCPSCNTRMPDIKVEPRPVLEEKPAQGAPFQGDGTSA